VPSLRMAPRPHRMAAAGTRSRGCCSCRTSRPSPASPASGTATTSRRSRRIGARCSGPRAGPSSCSGRSSWGCGRRSTRTSGPTSSWPSRRRRWTSRRRTRQPSRSPPASSSGRASSSARSDA
jgi:hypothetical protein